MTEPERSVCSSIGIDARPKPRESLEHRFWVKQTASYFEKKGYKISCEHPVKGNGAIDILAERPGEKVAVEVETAKSNTKTNLKNAVNTGFDRTILVATAAGAVRGVSESN
jgi:Holliday junction resolvase-like predicted endonuclease